MYMYIMYMHTVTHTHARPHLSELVLLCPADVGRGLLSGPLGEGDVILHRMVGVAKITEPG